MTYDEGRDAICNVFYNVWESIWPVAWGDLPATPPATETPWARVVLKHTNGRQSSLAGEVGTRRFTNSGFILISIFVPTGNANKTAYTLAQVISNAYKDARLDVWFRNIRMNEKGASGAFTQIDVLADFFYDEVR